MGKLAIYKYAAFMFLVVSVILTVFTIVALFGGRANPITNHGLAMLVYALPLLFIGDVVMAIYWIVRRRWHWLVFPLFAVLCCIPYIGTIYQPKLFKTADTNQPGINVATYNVAAFRRETSGFKSGDILSEMKKHKVDILCMQEYNDNSGDRKNSDRYKDYFPYMAYGREDMVVYSRYPIRRSEKISFGRTNNSAMWADVDVNGRVFRVFNAHLETTGFNRTLHDIAKKELAGQDVSENSIVKAIYGNYTLGLITRAHQSDMVAEAIAETSLPVILCGDFNDVPYSYTYYTMLGNLVDGFKECGEGFMKTFRDKNKPVRIDYIFHDPTLKGINYYKENLSYSDHDPVFMRIAL